MRVRLGVCSAVVGNGSLVRSHRMDILIFGSLGVWEKYWI